MHPSQRLSGSSAGFTLIELLLVVVLIGILTALAAPNLAGYIRSTKRDGALNELTGDIAYTRMLAVRSGQRARLTILSGGTSYIVEVEPVGATPTTAWRVAKRVNLVTGYRGVSLSASQPTLTFNSRGLLVSATNPPADMNIVAQGGGKSASLTVLQTGRAYRAY